MDEHPEDIGFANRGEAARLPLRSAFPTRAFCARRLSRPEPSAR